MKRPKTAVAIDAGTLDQHDARRRTMLVALASAALCPDALAGVPPAAGADDVVRLALAWRGVAEVGDAGADRAGVMELDWSEGRIHLVGQAFVPTRAHGLAALPDGGFVACANRPGRWLLRCDGAARPAIHLLLDHEGGRRTLNGHALMAADGRHLLTTETDPVDGRGWVSVRDMRSLRRVAEFESGGIDPHDLTFGSDGTLWVANGGIRRTPDGRKVERAEMLPSLVRLRPGSGELLERFTLDDAQLSLRHLAWAHGSEGGSALLGVALQAEHPLPEQRLGAPTLALHDGRALRIATTDASGAGYAGDIAAGPGGGFVISAQRARRVLWWHPARPEKLTLVGDLTEPCALVARAQERDAVLVGAARGVARWHLREAGAMVSWPVALAPDNHAVALRRNG